MVNAKISTLCERKAIFLIVMGLMIDFVSSAAPVFIVVNIVFTITSFYYQKVIL